MTVPSTKITFILLMLSACFLLYTPHEAEASCAETRFNIEDEVTGQSLGLIYTDTTTRRSDGDEVCLEGTFAGTHYQYLYTCTKTNYKFLKKFRSFQDGCKWGVIH